MRHTNLWPCSLCFSSFLPSAPAPSRSLFELQVSAVWVSFYLALSHDTHISNQASQFLFSSPWFSQMVEMMNIPSTNFSQKLPKKSFLLQTSLSFTYPNPRGKWISSIAMSPRIATAFLVCLYSSTPAHAGSQELVPSCPQTSYSNVIFSLLSSAMNSFLICTWHIWPFFCCWHFQ